MHAWLVEGKIIPKKRISIIGTGFVGLCTAVGFASKGYDVITSTNDPEKAALIKRGIPPFYESKLKELLQRVVGDGYLRCLTEREEAILNTEITFVTVGTPSQPNGSIDLQFIEKSAYEIAEALQKKIAYHLLVVKSTVIPNTTEKMFRHILEEHSGKRCGQEFGICVNPEFLREGSAIHDTLHPDRIIIGEYDKRSGDTLESLYRGFYGPDLPTILRTNPQTAELIKYANNAFLAMKVSFINSIANLCERIPGADVATVAKGIGLDERVGPLFLRAGLGYGGSCLPKDVKALIAFSRDSGYEPTLIDAIEEVNRVQVYRAVEFTEKLVGDLKEKQIAVLGLAFKPGTDDMREATSTKVVNDLLNKGAKVVVYDPMAIDKAKEIFDDRVSYASSALDCIRNTVCCIVVTEWDEFRNLSAEDFVEHMKEPNVVDGRRIYDPEKFRRSVRLVAVGLGDY